MSITSRKFRHKVTGEIVTQVPLMQLNQYEEVRDDNVVENKKLPNRIQLMNQMWMKNNGDIVYVTSAGEYQPIRLNLQTSAPKMFSEIVRTHGTSEGKAIRERAFYAIAKTLQRG